MNFRAVLVTSFSLLVFVAAAQAKVVSRKKATPLPEKAAAVEAPVAEAPSEGIDPVVPQSLDTPEEEASAAKAAAATAPTAEETLAKEISSESSDEAKIAVEAAVSAAVSGDDGTASRSPASTSENKAIEASRPAPLAKSSEAKTATATATAATQKESEIPVLSKATIKAKGDSSPYPRVLFSFLIVGLVAGGLVYFSRWYSRNTKKSSDNNRIRVLNQHFFGPKKSLAIVRIAGETVLIGITDQNINLLKSLSLLDDELPESTPARFSSAMTAADHSAASQESEAGEDMGPDEFLIGSIKDKISSKLKGMRNI